MKRRILSVITSFTILCGMMTLSAINAEASDEQLKLVDGSYLTTDDYSEGHSYTPGVARGQYLMTGDCSITKAGLTRVYAYGSTTANRKVNYMATIVYVDRYNEELDKWGQVYAWSVEAEQDYYLSTSKTITVDRGYYYRVRARHLAGDQAPYYDETASFTDGILLP